MQYELVVIAAPNEEPKDMEKRLTTLLTKEGFSVEEILSWGKRHLAYPMKKQVEGSYFSFKLKGNPGKPNAVTSQLTLDDKVLRHLILKTDQKSIRQLTDKVQK